MRSTRRKSTPVLVAGCVILTTAAGVFGPTYLYMT
jgi:hypothetical protein